MSTRLQTLGAILALAAAYFAAGQVGRSLAFASDASSAVWPLSGLGLASLLIIGTRAWPGVLAGALLHNYAIVQDPVVALTIATGECLEALIGAVLVNRFANGRDFFRQTRSYLQFVVLAALGTTVLHASIGVFSLSLTGHIQATDLQATWLAWWLSDASSALIVAPLITTWYAGQRLPWTRARRIESLLLLASVLAAGLLVFGPLCPRSSGLYPVVMPLLLWPACRMGYRETATTAFIISLIALLGTLHGNGPFADDRPSHAMAALQTLMGVVAMTSMVIAAATAERMHTTAALKRYQRDLEAANARLNEQCLTDALTGAANRRAFETRVEQELARARRYPAPLSLLILDVDRFRQINQLFGHGGADEILRKVASLLAGQLRTTDLLARYGGDEFVVILPNTPGDEARAVAERCRRAVASERWERRSVTVSIGAASWRPDCRGAADLVADADEALFRAKAAGRNRVSLGAGARRRTGVVQAAQQG